MENFQLYRTNILLGGQMKWDMILEEFDGRLIVNDFHLSPISPDLPCNRLSDDSLLNYSHQENIKKFYKTTEGAFFKTQLDPQLSHNWLVLSDKSGKVYEDSYEAGARNASYNLYKKPIEIFCPVWIEKVNTSISFKLNVYTKTGKKIISRAIDPMHGKFGIYLNNYIKHLGLNQGVDDVISVDLKNKSTTITGISLDSGNIVKKELINVAHNLLHRERTMLEFDSMLINNFSNNKMIARQLFNFCFYLDMNDLMSSHMVDMIAGSELRFEIITVVDGYELECRDFYSNYEYIARDVVQHNFLSEFVKQYDEGVDEDFVETNAPNVLDYLLDYRCVDHINKNKYVQNVVHWSLNNNKEYIFNIYNGFGAYDLKTGVSYSHRYGKTPDLLYSSYNGILNNSGWCNLYELDDIDSWLKVVTDDNCYEKFKSKASDLKPLWVNNVLYGIEDLRNEPGLIDFNWKELRCVIITAKSNIYNELIRSVTSDGYMYETKKLDDIGELYYARFKSTDDFICLIINEIGLNKITFRGFSNLLNKSLDPDLKDPSKEDINSGKIKNMHPLYYIKRKMKSVKHVPLVVLDKSLYIAPAPSPSSSTKEIEYYKDDNAIIDECYVLRYDGKIKPTFITRQESELKNRKYFKRYKTETEYLNSDFTKYSNSNYPPAYPSINYCAWEWEHQDFLKWNNRIPILIPEIEVNLKSKRDNNDNLTPIKTLVMEYIKSIYPELKSEEIYNLYNVENSYDYETPYNINDYVYKIKMILK